MVCVLDEQETCVVRVFCACAVDGRRKRVGGEAIVERRDENAACG